MDRAASSIPRNLFDTDFLLSANLDLCCDLFLDGLNSWVILDVRWGLWFVRSAGSDFVRSTGSGVVRSTGSLGGGELLT